MLFDSLFGIYVSVKSSTHVLLHFCVNIVAQAHLHLMQSGSSEFGIRCKLAQVVHVALLIIIYSRSLFVALLS